MTRVTHIEETVTIGGDLTVGRIGYGAMQLTGPKVWGEYPDHDKGVALLREVVAAGVTFIDTADAYGPHSNGSSSARPCTRIQNSWSSPPRADSSGAAPSTPTWAPSGTRTTSATRRT
jgi:diketogulonate reductase-like aldo/keto reductase